MNKGVSSIQLYPPSLTFSPFHTRKQQEDKNKLNPWEVKTCVSLPIYCKNRFVFVCNAEAQKQKRPEIISSALIIIL